jgi:oxygen-dependent protoporphyrinogen oxidase
VAAERLAGIPFVSTAVVFLGYRRSQVSHPLDGYGVMIPRSEGLRAPALSFFSTKWPGRAPEGHVLLRAFLGGARDPDILGLDDATLLTLAREELSCLLGLDGAPTLSRLFRWPAGTPQMEVGHLDLVGEVERRVAEVPGLFVTSAGLRTTGIPDGVADATRVAREATAFLAG